MGEEEIGVDEMGSRRSGRTPLIKASERVFYQTAECYIFAQIFCQDLKLYKICQAVLVRGMIP